jgi:hypothetical protein
VQALAGRGARRRGRRTRAGIQSYAERYGQKVTTLTRPLRIRLGRLGIDTVPTLFRVDEDSTVRDGGVVGSRWNRFAKAPAAPLCRRATVSLRSAYG